MSTDRASARKHVVAAAVALVGGMALAFTANGEGAFAILSLVGVPALLVALFVLPLRSSLSPRDLRRVGWGAAAVLSGGLLLLAAAAPKFAVLLVLLAALYLMIAWPVAVSSAGVMAVAAVRSGLSAGPTARRTWGRMSWTWLLALVATYGYGFSHFDDAMGDVKDRVCRFDPSGGQPGHSGGQSLLPLSDTTCGADTVPGFVNPLLAVLAALLTVCVAGYVAIRLRPRAAAASPSST
ncbi:hypothetical protein [Actinomadura miaoliensis]|uniref:hypothetical protein n=1 Tax=Actinomadura miaoliensis TaxID=430685 RepID=UPI0031EFA149